MRELDTAIDQADAMLRAEGLRGSLSHPATQERRPKRRVRSTRRRQDVPNLPAKQMSSQTIGQVYVGADGKEHRPSTFVTGTLDSYGRVHEDGSPVDPDSYDYRRAARDTIHFGDLLDRLWTNLRRVSGSTCSTSPRSNRSSAEPRTCTSRSAERSPASSSAR